MLKRVNIQSLLQANESLKGDSFEGFLKYFGIDIKAAEIGDLKGLAKALSDIGCRAGALDRFYVGYKIPQIGKEFDLLRFGAKFILNIELKNNSSEDKIKNQLLRNRYYFGFIGRKVYTFTFVSKSQELYFLSDDENLEKVEFTQLAELLATQEIDDTDLPDELFNPSDYLASPFNSTKKFLSGEYFLTHQQEEMKIKIINSIKELTKAEFISIIGSAGTGKTLLTYDIAKSFIESKRKTLIVHCGQLNTGHTELIGNGWDIIPIKIYSTRDFSNYDLIVIDEAQRIYPEQLDDIIDKINLAKCGCIFSHDKLQTLANWEETRDTSSKIGSIKAITQYKLSGKIRTNREIAAFIKMLFSNKESIPISSNGNIEINYFKTIDDAKNYLDALNKSKWEILRFTPSQYYKEHHEEYSVALTGTSHEIIGQEFDGVAVTIDEFFSYADNGELVYKAKTYYNLPKMLFQNITRARKRLNLVIINNEELLNRCIAILQ